MQTGCDRLLLPALLAALTPAACLENPLDSSRAERVTYQCADIPRPQLERLQAGRPDLMVVPAFEALGERPFHEPIFAVQDPVSPSFWWVGERHGRLWRADTTTGDKMLMLDMRKTCLPSSDPERPCPTPEEDQDNNRYFVHVQRPTDRVESNEAGLLSLAFHPEYAENGLFYLFYTGPDEANFGWESRVVEIDVANPGAPVAHDPADPRAQKFIFKLPHPDFEHFGGNIAFNPTEAPGHNYLHIGLGDGGGIWELGTDTGDTLKNLEFTKTFEALVPRIQGSILRVDVDASVDDPIADEDGVIKNYGIPSDNPFADKAVQSSRSSSFGDYVSFHGRLGSIAEDPFWDAAVDPEVWAWGFRNPWRWSFDRQTGHLWLGDVGQFLRDEINYVDQKGTFYGWSFCEGTLETPVAGQLVNEEQCEKRPGDENRQLRFLSSAINIDLGRLGIINFDIAGIQYERYRSPVIDHTRDQTKGIVGGFVYRGSQIPQLRDSNTYLYADFYYGTIFGVNADTLEDPKPLFESALHPASFAEDADGELYIVANYAGNIYKIVAAPTSNRSNDFPESLSATGCFRTHSKTGDILRNSSSNPAPQRNVYPFDVAAPLWSDGAEKRRLMSLPGDGKAIVEADGDWTFPIGTVLLKEFKIGDKLVETRLLIRHSDGDWGGYAYAWNEEQTDAFLLDSSQVVHHSDLGWDPTAHASESWTIPGPNDCMRCHSVASGRSLGPKTAQLNMPTPEELLGRFRPDTADDPRPRNQIEAMLRLDLVDEASLFDFAGAGNTLNFSTDLPAFKGYTSAAPAGERARAYLDSNCAHCHQPGGSAPSDADFRYGTGDDPADCDVGYLCETPRILQTGTVSVEEIAGTLNSVVDFARRIQSVLLPDDPDLPDLVEFFRGVSIIRPGSPEQSYAWLKMHANYKFPGDDVFTGDSTLDLPAQLPTPVDRMPPLGTVVRHDLGLEVLEEWVRDLGDQCPCPE